MPEGRAQASEAKRHGRHVRGDGVTHVDGDFLGMHMKLRAKIIVIN